MADVPNWIQGLTSIASPVTSFFNTGAQLFNNWQNRQSQEAINSQNLAYQREVNAQNQYNLEHGYEIAVESAKRAGLSPDVVNGIGNPQVASSTTAQAPQSQAVQMADMGAQIRDALMSFAQYKSVQADTAAKETNMQIALKKLELEEQNQNFNQLMMTKEFGLANSKFQYGKFSDQRDYDEKKRQYDLSYSQDESQFLRRLEATAEQNALDRELAQKRYELDQDKYNLDYDKNDFYERHMIDLLGFDYDKLAQEFDIANMNDKTKRDTTQTQILGNLMGSVMRMLFLPAFMKMK